MGHFISWSINMKIDWKDELNIKLMKCYLEHIGNSDKKLGNYLQDKSIKVVVVDDKVGD